MIQLNLFVAGAKELIAQRKALKEVASDLTAEYNNKGISVAINLNSYENSGDNQQGYNEFIDQKADLFILILEEEIGKRTEDEYMHAVKSYQTSGHPEIHAFVKSFDKNNRSEEKGYIEGLLNGSLGKYYISYSSIEDLAQKTKEKIKSHIELLISNPRLAKRKRKGAKRAPVTPTQPAAPKSSCKCSKFGKVALSVAVVAVAAVLIALLHPKSTQCAPRQEMVTLFIGGGSASSYLRQHPTENCAEGKEAQRIDIRNIENAMYANMPSGVAYSLLTEYIVNPQYKSDTLKGLRYYPVMVSASKATTKDFLEIYTNEKDIIDEGRILAFEYGKDTLKVYLHRDIIDKGLFRLADKQHKTIGISELSRLFNTLVPAQKAKIYHTSSNSGTYKTYKETMEIADCDLTKYDSKDGNNIFTSKTLRADIEGDDHLPYIILGSKSYTVGGIDDTNSYRLSIYDDSKEALSKEPLYKSIYLYFPAYDAYDKNNKNALYVSDNVIELLDMMGQETEKIENNLIYRKHNNLIIYFPSDISFKPIKEE